MSGERFPPPRGEGGFRDASLPSEEIPEAAESVDPHVIAKLADDPDLHIVESLHPRSIREEKPPAMRRVIVAFVMLLVVLACAVVIRHVLKLPAPIQVPR